MSSLRAVWLDMEPHLQEEAAGELVWLQQSLTAEESETLSREYNEIKRLVERRCGHAASSGDVTRTILETSPEDLRPFLVDGNTL